ncbi:MAG: hypothetical protein ACXWXK_08015 [Actinomycetota bacterium]
MDDVLDRPARPERPSTRAIVLAILASAVVVAITLVLIDLNRVARCERYGEHVVAFYERQSNIETATGGDGEWSSSVVTAALLEVAGYPPPGCQLP